MNHPLPVTLVGGFPGAGKTSLLHHFISERAAGPVAVFMESGDGFGFDARALKGLCRAANRTRDSVEEIPEIEEAAQIDWLARALKQLGCEGGFERVLIEVNGTSNPARLGRNFGLFPGHSDKFAPWAKLNHIICVIDALDFFRGVVLPSRRGRPAPFLDFQRTQIEGASLLILNKCDLVQDSERAACLESLLVLNPTALFIETAYGELPAEIWSRPGTIQEIGLAFKKSPRFEAAGGPGEMVTNDPGLSSVLYRVHRPFHPGRFWNWFEADHPGLLRVKGLVWLATRSLLVGGVSRTRWQSSCGGAGIWWAALPREDWPPEPGSLQRMQETWREPYGDRRQELALLGDAGQVPDIARQLADCLLSDEEYARPTSDWLSFPDPFPAWDVGDQS